MKNLTEAAYYTKKILKYGSIGLTTFLLLRAIFLTAISWWKKTHPPPPPPPTLSFGKIPAIKFPVQETKPPFYPRLETIDNRLPNFPPTVKVYFIPQQTSNLFAWEKAKSWAKQLGFQQEPETPDPYTFIFKSQGFPQTTLKMDVLNGNFTLSYDYLNDLTLVGLKNAPRQEQAIGEAKGFLQRAGVLTSDLASGNQEAIYLRFEPPNLEPAIALSEADLTLVNFFRADIEGIKVMPPNPKKSLVSVLISGSDSPQKRILEVNYTHFPINETIFATYPLKDINQAWNQLQKKEAYLANFGQNYDSQVTIRKIYLAYFDPPDEQKFLEPIYVFEGDRDFLAYIPALDPQYTFSE